MIINIDPQCEPRVRSHLRKHRLSRSYFE
jgi:hypothetical protein